MALRITKSGLRVLRQGPSNLRITKAGLRVLRTVTGTSNNSQSVTSVAPTVAQTITNVRNVFQTHTSIVPTVAQTIGKVRVVPQSVTNTVVTATDSNSFARPYSQSVTDTSATVSQTIGIKKTLSILVSAGATSSNQSINGVSAIDKTVSNTAPTVAQTISFKRSLNVSVTDIAATVGQTITYVRPQVYNKSISQGATVFQTIGILDRVIHQTVTNTSPTASQEFHPLLTFELTVTSASPTVSQRVNSTYPKRITHTATAAQSVGFENLTVYTFSDDLDLADSYTDERYILRTLHDPLALTEHLSYSLLATRTLHDTLVFVETYPASLVRGPLTVQPQAPGTPLVRPTYHSIPGIVVAASNLVTFTSDGQVVTLPPPEWDNGRQNKSKVTTKKTMGGTTYIYKTTSLEYVLQWDFILDFVKALEIKSFLLANVANKFDITTWEGEVWRVGLITTPQELVSIGRSAGNYELTRVRIEMQGVKIHG